MTSLRSMLALASITSLLGLSACPAGDDTGESSDTIAATTMPMGMTDTGMEEGSSSSEQDSSGGSSGLSHAADIQPIWDEHCVTACHEADGEWGLFLDMTGDAHAAIVGVAAPQLMSMSHIEPGDPDASYIWHKINNTQVAAGGSGLPMPKARPGMPVTELTPEQLDTIEEWILAGAPE
ncbi:c-type cytochrome [Paraliomyxa miuraensis]|uniref:c-type cytochrome n=1 Tax=Paraliomyxa miuraensis TaxID=376150 RepID=UPI0022514AE9|nr:c-type cytochrome [Paraliomyxa miuraensis]MCX4243224.1 cytochrome c [Paraliomyxa miuraensis]